MIKLLNIYYIITEDIIRMKEAEKGKFSADTRKKEHKPMKKVFLSIGSILILILAAVSFIFIPAMVQGSGTELPPFGRFNKKPIEYKTGSYFASMVQYYSEQMKNNGSQLDESAYFSIFNTAFSSTVLNMAFTQAVEASGYIVPDAAIDRSMLPYFYDSNGVYSPKIFRDTPDTDKIELRNQIANGLVYQRYYDDSFGSQSEALGDSPLYGIKTASAETPFLQRMGERQRSFEYAAFKTADYPRTEAAAWGMQNPDLFTKYDMSVVSVSDENTAKKLLKQLQNNELVFEDAVAEYSRNYYSSTDGKVVNSYRYQLKSIMKDEQSLNELTGLEPGAISGVIPTVNGFSIFKLNAPAVDADFTDSAMIETVYSYMNSYEAGVIERYYVDTAKDFAAVATRSGFDAACAQYGLTKGALDAFPLNYNDNPLLKTMSAADTALAGASLNDNFLKTAFSMQKDEISSPIVVNKNVIVLKMTEEITVPAEQNSTVSILYPYYITQFDQSSVQSAIMSSDKLQNDFIQVYFNNFMKY